MLEPDRSGAKHPDVHDRCANGDLFQKNQVHFGRNFGIEGHHNTMVDQLRSFARK